MSADSLYRLHVFSANAPGTALFARLAQQIPGLSRSLARQAVQAGLVEVGGAVWEDPARPLPEGEVELRCDFRQGIRPRARALRLGERGPAMQVLHCDGDLAVVDKPAGLLSAPAHQGERGHALEELGRWLRQQGREGRYVGVVHRLDRETSGCLCLALTRAAQRLLSAQFAAHEAGRTYRCLVFPGPEREQGRLCGRIGRGPDGRRAVVGERQPGKDAVTHYQVLERLGQAAEVELRLETGRTHQIRIHLADLGCPVLGDALYGPRPDPLQAPRLLLHASALVLTHPRSGEERRFEAPLPAEYAAMRERLRG